jgi:hypothetical protein
MWFSSRLIACDCIKVRQGQIPIVPEPARWRGYWNPTTVTKAVR